MFPGNLKHKAPGWTFDRPLRRRFPANGINSEYDCSLRDVKDDSMRLCCPRKDETDPLRSGNGTNDTTHVDVIIKWKCKDDLCYWKNNPELRKNSRNKTRRNKMRYEKCKKYIRRNVSNAYLSIYNNKRKIKMKWKQSHFTCLVLFDNLYIKQLR